MRSHHLAAAALSVAAAAVLVPPAASAVASPAAPVAVGTFSHALLGASAFRQTGPTSVTVAGRYAALPPQRSFFTVIYGNGNCDPAQAFPVGPFTTNRFGFGALDRTVTAPVVPGGLVAGTRSVSVRRGDDDTDIDGDGITGPGDVVAVAGSPSIGLLECDTTPFVR